MQRQSRWYCIITRHSRVPPAAARCWRWTQLPCPQSYPQPGMKKHDLTNKNTGTKTKTMTMTAPLSAVLPPTCSVSCHCWWYFALYIYIMWAQPHQIITKSKQKKTAYPPTTKVVATSQSPPSLQNHRLTSPNLKESIRVMFNITIMTKKLLALFLFAF